MSNTNPCFGCGFWDPDYESCTCPDSEMFYACPIESQKPENQKELENYIKWLESKNQEV